MKNVSTRKLIIMKKSKSEKMNTICEFFLIMGVRFLIDENILMQ